jgi:Mn2+/Fe2+ NRAMP family transporter
VLNPGLTRAAFPCALAYVNKRWNNIVNWTIITVLFALSLILAAQVIAPNLFPQR